MAYNMPLYNMPLSILIRRGVYHWELCCCLIFLLVNWFMRFNSGVVSRLFPFFALVLTSVTSLSTSVYLAHIVFVFSFPSVCDEKI